jgi:hypothetical protein
MISHEDITSKLARINSKLPELYYMIYSGYFSQVVNYKPGTLHPVIYTLRTNTLDALTKDQIVDESPEKDIEMR